MSEGEPESDERSVGEQRVEAELLGDGLDFSREVGRFDAMGEPTRFTILYLLVVDGPTASGLLADLLEREQNDLYYHLNKLEEAGLVGKYQRDGDRIYELSPLAEELLPQVFESIRTRAKTI